MIERETGGPAVSEDELAGERTCRSSGELAIPRGEGNGSRAAGDSQTERDRLSGGQALLSWRIPVTAFNHSGEEIGRIASAPVWATRRDADDHDLRKVIGLIGHKLEELHKNGYVAEAASVQDLLERLDRSLLEQYLREEKGEYWHEVLAVAPRLSRHVGLLRSDHPKLLKRCKRLLDLARVAGHVPEHWPRVHRAFMSLALEVLAHEEAEDRLIAEAFMRDLGGG